MATQRTDEHTSKRPATDDDLPHYRSSLLLRLTSVFRPLRPRLWWSHLGTRTGWGPSRCGRATPRSSPCSGTSRWWSRCWRSRGWRQAPCTREPRPGSKPGDGNYNLNIHRQEEGKSCLWLGVSAGEHVAIAGVPYLDRPVRRTSSAGEDVWLPGTPGHSLDSCLVTGQGQGGTWSRVTLATGLGWPDVEDVVIAARGQVAAVRRPGEATDLLTVGLDTGHAVGGNPHITVL